MSSITITNPNKEEILIKDNYLKWRNQQIRNIYKQLLNKKTKSYKPLMKATGLSWQMLWQIINYPGNK